MSVRRRIERAILARFDPEEVEDILEDLQELAAERGGLPGRAWYWVELCKYPLRRAWDDLRHRHADRRRTTRGGEGMEAFARELRYAVRGLLHDPGFTATAVMIITVGIGAAVAIFSVVDGVLLDPLPIEAPERLVSVWMVDGQGDRSRMTPGNFLDVSRVDGAFSSVAAFRGEARSLSLDGTPLYLRGGAVTPGYFETLGVGMVAGRPFRDDDAVAGAAPVVVLAQRVWRQTFGADPGLVGRTIRMDGVDVEVVGVAPPGVYPTQATVSAEIPFTESDQDFFVPLTYDGDGWTNRRSHVLGTIARLEPDIAHATARARLDALAARLRAIEPLNRDQSFLTTSFTDEVVGDVRFGLWTLMATVGLVLLIAVVNVGALFVLRADDRRSELAIRAALGASTARIVGRMSLESALISMLSAGGAVLLARLGIDMMRGLVPYQIPRLAEVTVDGRALGSAILVGTSIAIGLATAPALGLRGARWSGAIARGRQKPDARRRRLQSAVVALQAALCVIVLVGAALLTRSYAALRSVDPGFRARDTWTMSIPAAGPTLDEIVRRVRALPGVRTAAVAYDHPLERSWGDAFTVEGRSRSDSDPAPAGSLRPFGEGYFQTVDIEVVEGRLPDAVDLAGDVAYAVVNETLRSRYLGEGPAVGRRIVLPTAQRMLGTDGVFEIAAVVRDVRFLGPDQPAGAALYVPLTHFPVEATTLLVRPETDDTGFLDAVRGVVADVDGSVGVQEARRLGDVLDDMLARPRFHRSLLVSFAAIALVLCGLGAYGLVARTVAGRIREIGIQMALGAERSRLAKSVLADVLRPVLLGGLVGAIVSSGLARLLQSLLFGISPSDPVSYVSSAGFMLVVGAVAAILPTWRAISVDPAGALRAN